MSKKSMDIYFPSNSLRRSLEQVPMCFKGGDGFCISLLDLLTVHKELETCKTVKASSEARQNPIKRGEYQV